VGRPMLVYDMVKADEYAVEQWLPQDPGQVGKDRGQSYVRILRGIASTWSTRRARAHPGGVSGECGQHRDAAHAVERRPDECVDAVGAIDCR
jgi:hypothetical protein